jgi:hypothetical protein
MRAKGVLRNLRRGNCAKVVTALTPGSHQLVDWTAPKSDRILSGLGGFDVIFCMAVLRSAGHYPFESFEERALFLETLLRPGGLLVIHNSPYRFGDTARKYSYETIPVAAPRDIGSFLPDGVTEVEPEGSIFRKLEVFASRTRARDEAGNKNDCPCPA